MTTGEADSLEQGLRLERAGRLAEALDLYRRMARRMPRAGEPRFRAATVESALGEHVIALQSVDAALALEDRPVYRFARAEILERAGRLAEAVEALESLVAMAPTLAPAYSRLGELLLEMDNPAQALDVLRAAVRLRPDHVPTLNNLACACLLQGRMRQAEDHARQALALEPGHVRARAVLGQALIRQGARTRGEAELARAAQAADSHELWLQLANTRLELGRASEAIEAYDRAIALAPPGLAQVESARLVAMHYDERIAPEALFAAHEAWARRHASPEVTPAPRRARAGTQLRIGYVSPRLHRSAPASLIAPVLENHGAAFEIFCYAGSPIEDDMTDRLKRAATAWRNVAKLDDAELAQLMRRDGIDIAVDLAGHTPEHRLRAFAHKPAPVLVTWLEYVDTTGVPAIDALITDRWHSPPGDAQRFTESLVRLPRLRFCWEPPKDAPAVASLPAGAGIVFGSFNRLSKLSAGTLSLWCDVLRALPGSRMVVKSAALDNIEEHAPLIARFEARGIDPARIECRGASSHREMLGEYRDIHIALDSFPCNGCLVTLEALWMGRPVLTLAGSTLVSRQSAAILACAGLEALVAADADAFVARAVELATDRASLAQLSSRLREAIAASGILDYPRFTRDLEDAYRKLWAGEAKG